MIRFWVIFCGLPLLMVALNQIEWSRDIRFWGGAFLVTVWLGGSLWTSNRLRGRNETLAAYERRIGKRP